MHCLKLSNCPDKNATIYFKLSGTLLEKLDIIEDSLYYQIYIVEKYILLL